MTVKLLAEVSLLRNKVKKYEESIQKIKEEIKSCKGKFIFTDTNTGDGFYADNNSIIIALNIIDKHLKEVENESNV